MASQSLEVKKLVYLYLLHYAEKYVIDLNFTRYNSLEVASIARTVHNPWHDSIANLHGSLWDFRG